MKILTRKQQNEIAANLALIYHCVGHLDIDEESGRTSLGLAAVSLAEVAYSVGGLKMMEIIPELAAKVRDIERGE